MGNFHNFASFCHGIFHKLVPKKGVPKKRSRKEASTSQRRPTWSKVAQGCLRSSPHDAAPPELPGAAGLRECFAARPGRAPKSNGHKDEAQGKNGLKIALKKG